MAALPTLAIMIWELLFIPITERIQEADHGLVSNETVKRKVTGPYVSLVCRTPEVCSLPDSGSETWNTLLSYFVRYRQPQNAIKDFGLEKHPLWQGLLQSLAAFPKRRSGSSRQMWRALAMLLYYNDPEASYHQYVQARQKKTKRRGLPEIRPRRIGESSSCRSSRYRSMAFGGLPRQTICGICSCQDTFIRRLSRYCLCAVFPKLWRHHLMLTRLSRETRLLAWRAM